MTKILLKTLVITFAIQAISSTYAQAPDDALESEYEDNNSSVNLQIPDRRLSRQEVRDALSTLSSNINRLTKRLEQDSSSLEETSNRQRQLKDSVAGIKGELDRLKNGFSELTEKSDNLAKKFGKMAEELDEANKTAGYQHSEFTKSIKDTDGKISTLRDETVQSLKSQEKDIQLNTDHLNERISGLSSSVDTRVGEVEKWVGEVEKSVEDGFLSVESDVLFRTVAGAVLLLILSVLLILIRRQLAARHRVLSVEFADSSEAILERYNKLDLMLSELLSKQLSTIDESPDKHDHTLPLEVAAEVHRMRKRIARMPDDVKGVKQLEKALERLEDSLARKSYEIINLLGEKYVEGLNVNPRFSVDENFEPDMQIITNVIKPQVNYEDKIIQIADVEVSVGE